MKGTVSQRSVQHATHPSTTRSIILLDATGAGDKLLLTLSTHTTTHGLRTASSTISCEWGGGETNSDTDLTASHPLLAHWRWEDSQPHVNKPLEWRAQGDNPQQRDKKAVDRAQKQTTSFEIIQWTGRKFRRVTRT